MLTRSVRIITFSYSSLNSSDNENMNNDCRHAMNERKKEAMIKFSIKDLTQYVIISMRVKIFENFITVHL